MLTRAAPGGSTYFMLDLVVDGHGVGCARGWWRVLSWTGASLRYRARATIGKMRLAGGGRASVGNVCPMQRVY